MRRLPNGWYVGNNDSNGDTALRMIDGQQLREKRLASTGWRNEKLCGTRIDDWPCAAIADPGGRKQIATNNGVEARASP